MVLVINGQEASWSPQGTSVDEIRQEVGAWALNKGQALWELKLDGRLVDWDDVRAMASGDSVIEVVTRDMANLSASLVEEAVTYIPNLTLALATVSESIYSGEEEAALKLFNDCLEGLEWVIQTMRLTVGVGEHFGTLSVDADSGGAAKDTEQALAQIEEALRAGDTVLVADVLQSLLCPALEQWAQRQAVAGV